MRRAAGALLLLVIVLVGWLLVAPSAQAGGDPPPAPIVVTTADDVIDPGDGELSLREAVAVAEADGIDAPIQLAAHTTYDLTICDPEDDAVLVHHGGDDLVVQGAAGTVIDGCVGSGTFQVGGHLELRSVEVTGGGDSGFAPVVAQADTIVLDGVVVQGNEVDGGQADNLLYAQDGITIAGSTIDAGGVEDALRLWAVETYGPLVIEDSIITGVRGWDPVGAVLGAGVQLIDSQVVDNQSRMAAVASICDITMTDSSVARNTGLEDSELDNGPLGGGVLATGVVTAHGSAIEDNTATAIGGGIRAAAVRLDGTTVTGNEGRQGGAIDTTPIPPPSLLDLRPDFCGSPPVALDGSIVLHDVQLHANTAPTGGVLVAGGDLQVSRSTLTDNVGLDPQDSPSGSLLLVSGDAWVTSSSFEANEAADGYVIEATGRVVLVDSDLTDNHPQAAVVLGEVGVTVTDSEVHENTGALGPLTSGCDLVLDGVTATGNHATQIGGVGGSEGTAYLVDSALSANRSDGDAGAIVASAISVEGSTVSGNEAGGDGGGLLVDVERKERPGGCSPQPLLVEVPEGLVLLADTTLQDNVAGGDGGGLRAQRAVLERTTVAGNEAEGDGGGLALDLIGVVQSSTITSNRASTGGGVATFVISDPGLWLRHATIAANDASTADDVSVWYMWAHASAIGSPDSPGADCAVVDTSSSGANVTTDAGCGFSHPLDHVVTSLGLGDLGDHGGPTATRVPGPGSPLVDADSRCTAAPGNVDQRGVARPIGNGCDAGAVESPWVRFRDVGTGNPFFAEISRLAAEGVITGYDDRTFRPATVVSRQAAMAFLHRLVGSPPVALPSQPTFPDVGPGHPFRTEIEWAAAAGVTQGYVDGTFRPSAGVTRQALVAWLFDLVGPTFVAPEVASFDDVSPAHPFFAEVEWAAAATIVNGYGDGTFGPGRPVTRQAAAAILDRSRGLL